MFLIADCLQKHNRFGNYFPKEKESQHFERIEMLNYIATNIAKIYKISEKESIHYQKVGEALHRAL
jgi:hypothetical protein